MTVGQSQVLRAQSQSVLLQSQGPFFVCKPMSTSLERRRQVALEALNRWHGHSASCKEQVEPFCRHRIIESGLPLSHRITSCARGRSPLTRAARWTSLIHQLVVVGNPCLTRTSFAGGGMLSCTCSECTACPTAIRLLGLQHSTVAGQHQAVSDPPGGHNHLQPH